MDECHSIYTVQIIATYDYLRYDRDVFTLGSVILNVDILVSPKNNKELKQSLILKESNKYVS